MDPITGIDWEVAGSHGQVKFGNDKLTLAVFYTRSVINEAKSQEANRPIHDNKTFVRIQPAGERLNIVDRPVREEDKRRWPQQWQQYVAGRIQVPDGSPIELLFPNHPGIADTLKGCNVFTIEQLAQLSGNAIDNIGMGAQDWVNKANAYLQQADKGRDFNRMSKRLEDAEAQNRVLSNQLKQAIAQINALEERIKDPTKYSLNPGHIQGIDPQTDRINANRAAKVDFDVDKINQGALQAAKLEAKIEKDPYTIDTGDQY